MFHVRCKLSFLFLRFHFCIHYITQCTLEMLRIPRCRAFALSKSDLSISAASSRIDISRFWYCSMLVYIITRFLRAAHSRNRYRHSQSGLAPFLLMSVCSSHSDHALPASSHASLWMSLLYLIIPFSCVFGYSFV